MPYHNVTQLPRGTCSPNAVSDHALTVEDRVQLHEFLHRVYLCEDSRDHASLRAMLADDYVNVHPLFGRVEGANAFIAWLKTNPAGFDGIRHQCLNAVTQPSGDGARTVSYLLVVQLFPAESRSEEPSEKMDALLPRVIGHGVVTDDWARHESGWRLKRRVYDQMSIHPSFLPDVEKRNTVAGTFSEWSDS